MAAYMAGYGCERPSAFDLTAGLITQAAPPSLGGGGGQTSPIVLYFIMAAPARPLIIQH